MARSTSPRRSGRSPRPVTTPESTTARRRRQRWCGRGRSALAENDGSLAFSGAFADQDNVVSRGLFRGPTPNDAVVLEGDLFINIMSVDINQAGTIAFNSL